MAFRRKTNEHAQWREFCRKHQGYFENNQGLMPLIESADLFDAFLRTGIFKTREHEASIESMTDDQMAALVHFVADYSESWESYFTRTEYAAYFTELEKRGITGR